MKHLDYYHKRDLKNEREVFKYLMNTLSESIFTWDYFVDFEKVYNNVSQIETELNMLDSLLGLNPIDLNNAFIELIIENPKIRRTLPMLIALRYESLKNRSILDNIDTMNAETKQNLFNPRVSLNEEIIKDLITFFEQSGLKDLFMNKKVTSITDYFIGIEIGMDTNARKNRTGSNMEKIIEKHLNDFCSRTGFTYMEQATKINLEQKWDVDIDVDKIARRFDFALLSPDRKLTLLEVNYYSGGGSKLKSTAGEYKGLHTFVKNQGHKFIWITDGLGWETARTALHETFLMNDYVFNLEMISNGILEDVLLEK